MGSINDQPVGGWDTIGVWKNKLFYITKSLSWSLAKRKILTPPLDENFYYDDLNKISGWRCRHCGYSRIDKLNIEMYLSSEFLPKLIVEYIKHDKLIKILDLKNIIALDYIFAKRTVIEKLIKNKSITLTSRYDLFRSCPECESKNVCVYSWEISGENTQLIDSKNNLKM